MGKEKELEYGKHEQNSPKFAKKGARNGENSRNFRYFFADLDIKHVYFLQAISRVIPA